MAWTDSETARINTLEDVVNDLQTAITNLMSKLQMRQLLMLKQAEIDALTARVEALETQLTTLQNSLG
jgi:polyhydroxyalkanoate synthesis regulator phasin